MTAISPHQLVLFGGINLQSYCKPNLHVFDSSQKRLKGYLKKFDGIDKQLKSKMKWLNEKKK
jgi:hypothetical protein